MADVSSAPAAEAAEIAWHVAQLRQDKAGLAPDDPSRSDAARAYQQGWRDAYDKVIADLTARAVQRAATTTAEETRMADRTPPKKATDLGHTPEWDPPAAMTAALRWTCPCGATVIDYLGNVYGSATEKSCPTATGSR